MNEQLKTYYTDNAQQLAARIGRLKSKSRLFLAGQLFFFCLFVALLVLPTVIGGSGRWAFPLAAVAMAVYVAVRKKDVANSRAVDRMTDLKAVYDKELRCLAGDYTPFDDGARYADPRHAYSYDMDIFGPRSLYQRISRCVSTGGADRLADILNTSALTADGTPEEISRRREAVDELAAADRWRVRFEAWGQRATIDTGRVMKAFGVMAETKVAPLFSLPVTVAIAWVVVAGFWLLVALAAAGVVSGGLPVWWGVVQFALVFTLTSASLRNISKGVGALHGQLKSCVSLMRLISTFEPQSAGNRLLTDSLRGSGNDALQAFAGMEKILDSLDRRGNVLGMVMADIAGLSDFFLVRRFLRWQHRYMDNIPVWIKAVVEMDARVSMATFAYNHPEGREAVFVDSGKTVYEARGLYHPFLGDKAVANDFTIADRNYYIITGANMAGKSTFLRALGINYILARTGMPVFASQLKVSVFALFSSMRTADDLTHGISYFNAELLRLQQLIESCKRSARTLIILDEILKGTNSLDKLNGSRMFLEAISALPVSGVIATHDLELSKMADSDASRFHNYCFEIRLSDEITYTYKITPGVARNQNATYLLNKIISGI